MKKTKAAYNLRFARSPVAELSPARATCIHAISQLEITSRKRPLSRIGSLTRPQNHVKPYQLPFPVPC